MTTKHPDEDEDLIQILPDEIQSGTDADGLPRTDPSGDAEKVVEPAEEHVAKKAKGGGIAPEDAIDAIQKDLDEERQRSETRKREADEARRALTAKDAELTKTKEVVADVSDRNLRAHWDKVNSDKAFIEAAAATTQQRMEQIERDLEAAVEASNGKAVVALTKELAKLEGDLRDLSHGSQAAETAVKDAERVILAAREKQKTAATEPKTPKEPEVKSQSPDDWITGIRSQIGSKPADWLTDHKDFVTDAKKHRQLLTFTDYYASKGKPLNSNDFIAALNAEFFPEDTDMTEEDGEAEIVETPKAQAQPRKSAPAAPVSRSTAPSQSSSTNGGIKLTQEQYNAAPELITAYEDLDPDFQTKFKVWSPTAARFQYERNLKRAQKDQKFQR